MRRELIRTTAFVRAAKRAVKKSPELANRLSDVLALLAEDAFDPALKSHKLHGDLEGSWACTAGYDLRVVFVIVDQGETPSLLLMTIGTHDEVY